MPRALLRLRSKWRHGADARRLAWRSRGVAFGQPYDAQRQARLQQSSSLFIANDGEECPGVTVWQHVTRHVWKRVDGRISRAFDVGKLMAGLIPHEVLLIGRIDEEARH